MKNIHHLFFLYLTIIAFIVGSVLAALYSSGLLKFAVAETPTPPLSLRKVILVPLDSRPPCTSFVQKIGAMNRMSVVLPPVELLDNYRRPAKTTPIFTWSESQLLGADALIISVDMLIHGGLIASRASSVSTEDAQKLISWIQSTKQKHPNLTIYAFSIIPRLLIADHPETIRYRALMAEWSILSETVLLNQSPSDIRRKAELESIIPATLRERYTDLYKSKTDLNFQLIQLVKQGTLDLLVIGQDDSSPFGLGNMERKRIQSYLSLNPILRTKVFETRGTDEVALTLIGRLSSILANSPLKASVEFTTSKAKDLVMPYMPGTISETVNEKFLLTGTVIEQNHAKADYNLIIHAGTKKDNITDLAKSASMIKARLDNGKNVAFVDLSEDFSASRTLLPLLKQNGAAINRFISYAGWNTTSNSIATAISQANAVLTARQSYWYPDFGASIEILRTEFLTERFLDDWVYQKLLRPVLNDELASQHIDPYSLGKERDKVSARIQQKIRQEHSYWLQWAWRNNAWQIDSSQGSYVPANWLIESHLPWDRTFEVDVNARLSPAKIMGNGF